MGQLMSYADKLKHPNWQRKRLEILSANEFTCELCQDNQSTLHVHHRYYKKNKELWDYPNSALMCLCESCHDFETKNRGLLEKTLAEIMRRVFVCSDLDNIITGIENSNLAFPPEVYSDMIKRILTCRSLAEKCFSVIYCKDDKK